MCSKRNARCGEQTDPYGFESLSRMSKLINLRRAASSRTHLVLQAYCLTDVDEINPLGIEIWYRTTRSFSILCGIEAIRSVPKKYWTRYPALRTGIYQSLIMFVEVNHVTKKRRLLRTSERVDVAHQARKVYKTISKEVRLHKSTVRQIVNKWRKFKITVTFPRSGQPSKITLKQNV